MLNFGVCAQGTKLVLSAAAVRFSMANASSALALVRQFKPVASAARRAAPGDCFHAERGGDSLYCLPTVINIGVQKAGTGELQTWLGVHPQVLAHGGEVHFFDGMRSRSCHSAFQAGKTRLRYAKHLWRRRPLQASSVADRVIFEKTPAYFDEASPQVVSCVMPGVRLVVMLRRPVERAYSAYRMCQRELKGRWCRLPFDTVVAKLIHGEPPRASRKTLDDEPQWSRMLLMGQYALHLRRWLRAFEPAQMRILWLEQFKRDPFLCMSLLERYMGIAHHDYHQRATRNQAGYWVVGKSKTNAASTSEAAAARLATPGDKASSSTHISAESKATLEAFYAPWQRRLLKLMRENNVSLLPIPADAVDVPG